MQDYQAHNSTGKLTIFLMTEKGYRFLCSIPPQLRPIIQLIVVGNDRSLQKDFEADIVDFCDKEGIPWVSRANFTKISSEFAMSISWRWLIDHPAEKLIVFHDSLLPKYRGFAPLVNAMINGDTEVGVTAIFGASEFDTGDIIAQASTTLRYPIKIQDAITQVNECYHQAGLVVLQRIFDSAPISAVPQQNELATYSLWRDEADYEIDWTQTSAQIRRQIDAVGPPYKGAYSKLDGDLIRIHSAVEIDDVTIENRHAGKVLFVTEGKPVVVCGRGMLQITDATVEKDGGDIPFFPIKKFRMRFSS